mmetsp:Transcript_44/g.145  ORF Transcript_44/g.145 Transcript_44/m.145 type:complete len:237 (-) Transcript_44:757-1467(-)
MAKPKKGWRASQYKVWFLLLISTVLVSLRLGSSLRLGCSGSARRCSGSCLLPSSTAARAAKSACDDTNRKKNDKDYECKDHTQYRSSKKNCRDDCNQDKCCIDENLRVVLKCGLLLKCLNRVLAEDHKVLLCLLLHLACNTRRILDPLIDLLRDGINMRLDVLVVVRLDLVNLLKNPDPCGYSGLIKGLNVRVCVHKELVNGIFASLHKLLRLGEDNAVVEHLRALIRFAQPLGAP